MKPLKIFISSALLLFLCTFAYSQSVTVKKPIGMNNENASTTLVNNLMQALTLNGISTSGKGHTITPYITISKEEKTSSTPSKNLIEFNVRLSFEDGSGKALEETSFTVKGIGDNEAQAYVAAIRNISSRNPKVKAFIEKVKNKL